MDKPAFSSKKFLAFLISSCVWTAVIFYCLQKWADLDVWKTAVVLACVLGNQFIQVGYILGQAALDRFVRVAQLTTSPLQLFKDKAERGEGVDLPPNAVENPENETDSGGGF